MKKLILSCFLSALCLTTAFAVDYSGTCGENLTWVYDQESCVLTISGTGSMDDYDTQSRPWSSSITDKAKSLVIREGVTTIGKEAFKQFYKLQSISIPTSLQSIGDKAFYSSEHIILSELTGNYSIGEYVFHWNKGITRLTISGNIKIGHYAFQGCDNLQSLTIKDNVSIEGNNAFDSCDRLKSVTIGGNVNMLGRNTFDACDSLSTVQIQEGIKTLPDKLFYRCQQLANVTLPSSLETIKNGAFEKCDSLKSVNLPNNLKSIEQYAFADCGLTTITIPINAKVSGHAFGGCSKLETATVHGIRQYYTYLFSNCPNLHTIYWHVKNGGSDHSPIDQNPQISRIFFGDEVDTIPQKLCDACTNLQYVEIGKNVKHIKDYAFQNCPKLKKIRSYATTPPWIGLYGFFMTSNVDSVIVPCNSVEAYQNANFSNAYGWGNMNIVGDDNCGSGTTTYTVSVSSSNTSMGTVSGGGTYEEGATATVTATPKSGYKFTRWSNGNTTNPYSFTVTSNVSLTAYFEQSSTPQPESSTFWNMSDAAFNSLGTISSNKTINGLTIYATSSKNVVIDGSNQEIDGLSFTHRLKLNGTGSSDARLLSFQVDGKCDIDVYLKSGSGSEDRTINVDKGSFGSSLTTIPALSTSISKETIHYTGGATTIYLYSPSGGVNIYAIRVTSESTPQPTTYTVSVSSANTSMGTVSGGGTYEEGATATVTATPKSGYKFTKWSNGSMANPYTFTVTSDVSLTAYFEQSSTPQPESSTFWNFSDAAFSSLGTITSTKTVQGLTLCATSDKNMVVDESTQEIDGISFTHRLKLNGTGDATYRSLKFNITGDCIIDIYAKSGSSSADRLLNIDKGSFGNTYAQASAYGSAISKATVQYTGGATTIYVYSSSSGINLYGIRVTYKNTEDIENTVVRTEAQKILRNGQIFILRGDKTYTLQGQEVK